MSVVSGITYGSASKASDLGNSVESWHGQIPGPLAFRARELANAVAERLVDPQRLVELAVRAADQATHPTGWHYPGFAHGHAGVALLHIAAARATTDDAARAHALEVAFGYIREAVSGTQIEPLDSAGVFSGTSGLALCLADCCLEEPRFRPTLARLHESLVEQVAAMDLTREEMGVSDSDYDLISGVAGTLAYLCTIDEPDTAIRKAIDRLVSYLVWLGGVPENPSVPHRWLVTPENYSPHELTLRPKGGYLNLGTAHGLPGAAAVLATAIRAGYRSPGDEAALRRMTSWIMGSLRADEHGPVWPAEVAVSEQGTPLTPDERADQLAWCYGTAGVAACLLTVADALNDMELRQTAVESFEAVLRRTRVDRSLTPTFCHGRAGLLAICLEFAANTTSDMARDHAPLLLEELAEFADPTQPLLFADQDEPGNFVDSPALLVGATGVGLTLFAAISDRRPFWLCAFLAR